MKKVLAILLFTALSLPAWAEMRWLGDADGDNEVTAKDAAYLSEIIIGKRVAPRNITMLDINEDKQLDIADVILILRMVNEELEKKKVWVPEEIPVVDPDTPRDPD